MTNISKEEIINIVDKNSEASWNEAVQQAQIPIDKGVLTIEDLKDVLSHVQVINRLYTEKLVASAISDILDKID